MEKLHLREDLPFLLSGSSPTEQQEFLRALGPLTLEEKRFYTEDEFLSVFYEKLPESHPVFDQAFKFFHHVTDVNGVGSDLYYDVECDEESLCLMSAGSYVDYDEIRDGHHVDLFDGVQYAYQYGEEASLADLVVGQVEQFEVNFSEMFEPWQVEDARQWFLSTDLAWMHPKDRLEIVKASFDEDLVTEKSKKFDSYFGTKKFHDHQKIAKEFLTAGDNPLYQQWLGVHADLEFVLTQISLVILVESAGNEDPPPNGSFMGLMQVHKGRFPKYGPANFDGINYKDPEVNIQTGTRYLLEYCLGEGRNPDRTLSRAITNYNFGAADAARYRLGKKDLSEQAWNYLRDYMIYSRELGLDIV